MTKHYVEFIYPGAFFSETSTKEIKSRNAKITLPERAYGYRIFDQTEVQEGDETLRGQPNNYGPRYLRGEVFDLERVKREMPEARILISNMEGNGYKRVLKCRQGFIPMEDSDCLIEASQPL